MVKLKKMLGLNRGNFTGVAIGIMFVLFGGFKITMLGIALVCYNLYILKENYEFEFPNK